MNYREYLSNYNFRRKLPESSILQKVTSIHERKFLLYVLSHKKELDNVINMIRKQKTSQIDKNPIDYTSSQLNISSCHY